MSSTVRPTAQGFVLLLLGGKPLPIRHILPYRIVVSSSQDLAGWESSFPGLFLHSIIFKGFLVVYVIYIYVHTGQAIQNPLLLLLAQKNTPSMTDRTSLIYVPPLSSCEIPPPLPPHGMRCACLADCPYSNFLCTYFYYIPSLNQKLSAPLDGVDMYHIKFYMIFCTRHFRSYFYFLRFNSFDSVGVFVGLFVGLFVRFAFLFFFSHCFIFLVFISHIFFVQLGLGAASTRLAPTHNPLLSDVGGGVVSVSAGANHSVCALASGMVMGWGHAEYNQQGVAGT